MEKSCPSVNKNLFPEWAQAAENSSET